MQLVARPAYRTADCSVQEVRLASLRSRARHLPLLLHPARLRPLPLLPRHGVTLSSFHLFLAFDSCFCP